MVKKLLALLFMAVLAFPLATAFAQDATQSDDNKPQVKQTKTLERVVVTATRVEA